MCRSIVMLAKEYTAKTDPSGWWMSEKLDGVRAYWTGTQFQTRTGRRIKAPAWFCAGMPLNATIDGELWTERGQFERSSGIVMGGGPLSNWRELRFHAFDAPDGADRFEDRLESLHWLLSNAPYATVLSHTLCESREHLAAELARLESLGAEGIMIRKPGSLYERKRCSTMLKVKTRHDSEAMVREHLATPAGGCTLLCELADGTQFAVGSGMTEHDRHNPPPLGSLITFRHQGFTDRGLPRFPAYLRSLPLAAT